MKYQTEQQEQETSHCQDKTGNLRSSLSLGSTETDGERERERERTLYNGEDFYFIFFFSRRVHGPLQPGQQPESVNTTPVAQPTGRDASSV